MYRLKNVIILERMTNLSFTAGFNIKSRYRIRYLQEEGNSMNRSVFLNRKNEHAKKRPCKNFRL